MLITYSSPHMPYRTDGLPVLHAQVQDSFAVPPAEHWPADEAGGQADPGPELQLQEPSHHLLRLQLHQVPEPGD